jgi:hypothetical protein
MDYNMTTMDKPSQTTQAESVSHMLSTCCIGPFGVRLQLPRLVGIHPARNYQHLRRASIEGKRSATFTVTMEMDKQTTSCGAPRYRASGTLRFALAVALGHVRNIAPPAIGGFLSV